MAITLLTQQRAEDIQENINSNHRNAITGDILANNMLTLNTDFYDGQISYSEHLEYAPFQNMIVGGRLLGNWKTFADEYWAGDFDRNYIAIYNGTPIIGYLYLQKVESGIQCMLIGNIYDKLDSFYISYSSWYILDVMFRDDASSLTLKLPDSTTSYSSRASMLSALGISAYEYDRLTGGRIVYIWLYNQNIYYPIKSFVNRVLTIDKWTLDFQQNKIIVNP